MAVPVNIKPSARKNSAAFAVSTKETSLVIECELKSTRKYIYISIFLINLCFFLISANIKTSFASMNLR